MTPTMTCAEFLESYSDYRDGLMGEAVRAKFDTHLGRCDRCRRYHVRLARGVLVLQNSGEIEPSPHLKKQLRERIAAGRSLGLPSLPAYAGVAMGLMVAVSAGLLLFGTGEPSSDVAQLDSIPFLPAAPVAPPPGNPVVPPAPLMEVPAFGAEWRAPGADEEPYIMKASLTR